MVYRTLWFRLLCAAVLLRIARDLHDTLFQQRHRHGAASAASNSRQPRLTRHSTNMMKSTSRPDIRLSSAAGERGGLGGGIRGDFNSVPHSLCGTLPRFESPEADQLASRAL